MRSQVVSECHAQLDLPAATSTSASTLAFVAATTTAVRLTASRVVLATAAVAFLICQFLKNLQPDRMTLTTTAAALTIPAASSIPTTAYLS